MERVLLAEVKEAEESGFGVRAAEGVVRVAYQDGAWIRTGFLR